MSEYGNDASITGSLTVDGEIILGHGGDDDVNIDSNTLFVDASTNRVGIGTNSPSATLEVSGTLKITGADEPALLMLDDQDGSAQIGRAHVGYVGSSDFAAFAHQDRATATEYALAHRSTGQTDINTAAGTNLTLRYASAIRAQLDTNGYFSIGSNYAPGSHKLETQTATRALNYTRTAHESGSFTITILMMTLHSKPILLFTWLLRTKDMWV